MASINGVTVKNYKTFMGWEGECEQGNVYIDGKKQGFWSQDAHGGCDTFDFDTKLLDEKAKDYVDSFGESYKYKCILSIEGLMSDITDLIYDEKIYKKNVKNGWNTTIVVTDGYHYSWVATNKTDKEEALAECKADIDEFMEDMFKNSKIDILVYTSLDDFNIICDKTHPIPTRFLVDEKKLGF